MSFQGQPEFEGHDQAQQDARDDVDAMFDRSDWSRAFSPHACPRCRDRDRYLVTWADDRAMAVGCRYCGHVFKINARDDK